MAVSDVTTSKLLNRWWDIMKADPYLYNQITGTGIPIPDTCGEKGVFIQVDRDQIADALNDSVESARDYLNFYPRPTYLHARLYLQAGVPIELQELRLPNGYLVEFGRRATTLIEANVNVTYTDDNGDGVLDLATMTLTLATDVAADEIDVFFRTADGAPDAANDLWEIEPLRVVKSGLNVTITGHRSLFVKPSVWAVDYDQPTFINKASGDVNDAADFVTDVDVYRVYTDPTNAVIYNADPIWDCGSAPIDGDVQYAGTGRIVDYPLSTFQPRRSDSCALYYAETVDVWYLAGLPLENGLMQRRMERALVRLSNTFMGQTPSCFCDRVLNIWTQDTKKADPDTLPEWLASNPLGLLGGAVEAWRVISRMAIPGGGKLTTR